MFSVQFNILAACYDFCCTALDIVRSLSKKAPISDTRVVLDACCNADFLLQTRNPAAEVCHTSAKMMLSVSTVNH
jgi:hypothetical protein